MTLSPGRRKLALTVHLASSVGWIGAVVAYLALGVAAVTGRDAQTVRGAWTAMEVAGWWAIVPLALAALVTGLVMALGTPWGLFRHYWVLISFALTVLCTVVLLLHMPSVSATAAMLRRMDVVPGANGAGHGAMGGDLLHPGAGLIVLLAIMVLNVYKPRGLTPYGWRKQQEERARLQTANDASATVDRPVAAPGNLPIRREHAAEPWTRRQGPGARRATVEDTPLAGRRWIVGIPIWVRVPGIIALVLVGVVIGSLLLGRIGAAGQGGGGHGQMGQTGQMAGMDHSPVSHAAGTSVPVTPVGNAALPGQHPSSDGGRRH